MISQYITSDVVTGIMAVLLFTYGILGFFCISIKDKQSKEYVIFTKVQMAVGLLVIIISPTLLVV